MLGKIIELITGLPLSTIHDFMLIFDITKDGTKSMIKWIRKWFNPDQNVYITTKNEKDNEMRIQICNQCTTPIKEETKQTVFFTQIEDETYRFCSMNCLVKFNDEPDGVQPDEEPKEEIENPFALTIGAYYIAYSKDPVCSPKYGKVKDVTENGFRFSNIKSITLNDHDHFYWESHPSLILKFENDAVLKVDPANELPANPDGVMEYQRSMYEKKEDSSTTEPKPKDESLNSEMYELENVHDMGEKNWYVIVSNRNTYYGKCSTIDHNDDDTVRICLNKVQILTVQHKNSASWVGSLPVALNSQRIETIYKSDVRPNPDVIVKLHPVIEDQTDLKSKKIDDVTDIQLEKWYTVFTRGSTFHGQLHDRIGLKFPPIKLKFKNCQDLENPNSPEKAFWDEKGKNRRCVLESDVELIYETSSTPPSPYCCATLHKPAADETKESTDNPFGYAESEYVNHGTQTGTILPNESTNDDFHETIEIAEQVIDEIEKESNVYNWIPFTFAGKKFEYHQWSSNSFDIKEIGGRHFGVVFVDTKDGLTPKLTGSDNTVGYDTVAWHVKDICKHLNDYNSVVRIRYLSTPDTPNPSLTFKIGTTYRFTDTLTGLEMIGFCAGVSDATQTVDFAVVRKSTDDSNAITAFEHFRYENIMNVSEVTEK